MTIDTGEALGVLGLGHDVVDLPAFLEQLNVPGSTFRALFSTRELRQSAMRAQLKGDGETTHLAARWAGKEAVIKAWEEALGHRPSPYTVEVTPWPRIEILDDSRGRPHVVLSSEVDDALHRSLAVATEGSSEGHSGLVWHISLSHDGAIASAVALLCGEGNSAK
jgi:holo-[acyl-carrier protein] synthase